MLIKFISALAVLLACLPSVSAAVNEMLWAEQQCLRVTSGKGVDEFCYYAEWRVWTQMGDQRPTNGVYRAGFPRPASDWHYFTGRVLNIPDGQRDVWEMEITLEGSNVTQRIVLLHAPWRARDEFHAIRAAWSRVESEWAACERDLQQTNLWSPALFRRAETVKSERKHFNTNGYAMTPHFVFSGYALNTGRLETNGLPVWDHGLHAPNGYRFTKEGLNLLLNK